MRGDRSRGAGWKGARYRDRASARSRCRGTASEMAYGVPKASAPSPAPPPAVSYFGLSAASRSARGIGCRQSASADRIGSGASDETDRLMTDLNRSRTELKPGTLLTREWSGHLQRVMVLADGFSW